MSGELAKGHTFPSLSEAETLGDAHMPRLQSWGTGRSRRGRRGGGGCTSLTLFKNT